MRRNVKLMFSGVPGDDEIFLPPSCEESEEVDRSRLQQGWWSHTSTSSGMWFFDPNQRHKITMDERDLNQAVDAYFTNDPYYRRPPLRLKKPRGGVLPGADSPVELLQLYEDEENWTTFRDGYLANSAELLKNSVGPLALTPGIYWQIHGGADEEVCSEKCHSCKKNGWSFRAKTFLTSPLLR
jgi:hypothetical protein